MRNTLGLSIALAVAMLVMCGSSGLARCTANPSVSVTGAGNTNDDGSVTLTATYSYPDTLQEDRWFGYYIDGNGPIAASRPAAISGSIAVSLDFSCNPGAHSVHFYVTSCGGTRGADQDFQVTAPANEPSLTLTSTGPDANGLVRLTATADFPNTRISSQRYMNVYLDGNGLFDSNPFRPSGQHAVWEPTVSLACLPDGTHTIGVTAAACGSLFWTYREVTVSSQGTPEVDLVVTQNSAGSDVAGITYDFTGTPGFETRWLGLSIDGGGWQFIRPAQHQGTWSVTLPACWHEAVARAVACGGGAGEDVATATNPVAAKPGVEVVDARVRAATPADNGQQTALVKWAMPTGSSGWRLRVETLPSIGHDRTTVGGGVLFDGPVATPTGEMSIGFTPPSGARTIVVQATASTSCEHNEAEATFQCGECQGAPQRTGDPVYFADGNMRYSDTDPLPSLLDGRGLLRTYDSQHQVRGVFGRGWTSMFDQRLLVSGPAGSELVSFTSRSNDVVMFRKRAGVFEQTWPRGTAPAVLSYDGAAGVYEYRAAGAGRTLRFRASDGRLVAERIAGSGRELSIAYDAAGKPLSASDSWTGLTWTITVSGQQITAIGVAGQPDLVWTYEYGSDDTLAAVRAPSASMWRRYEYANGRLTAVYDAADRLIESHTYDANGFAVSSHGPSDEIAAITYTPAGTGGEVVARVTLAAGAEAEFTMWPIAGALRTVRVQGGCSSCGGARDGVYAYDADGHLVRRQDARGYITETTYANGRVATTAGPLRPASCDPETDPNRCRLTADTLATATLAATSAKLTTRYVYADAAWPDRATTVATTSVTGGTNERIETFSFDAATGDVVQHSVQGWTGSPSQPQTRTTTHVYNDGVQGAPFVPGGSVFLSSWITLPQPRGTRRSTDGPRPGTGDTTQWLYYPVDSSVPVSLRGRVAAIRNVLGHIHRFDAYDVFGNPLRVVEPNGTATEATFDRLGRSLTRTIKGIAGCDTGSDPLCATDLTTTRTYSPAAGPLETEAAAGGGVTIYAYDARGRVTTVSRGPSATNLVERLEHVYDPMTALKIEERYSSRSAGSWIEKRAVRFAYDSEGRRTRTILPPFGAGADYEENVYGPDGDLAETKDARHATPNTKYDFDAAGRLASVKQLSAPGTWIETAYTYDVAGNLKSVRDPNGNVTTYEFDDFGQMLRQVSPVTGITTYVYDTAGDLVSSTDAANDTTTRTYDVAGRVLTATSTRPGAASEVVSWTYDQSDGGFPVGRLTKMTDPTGFTTYRYERRGLLAKEEKTFDGDVSAPSTWMHATRFEYDRDGNRSKIVYPSGQAVTYTHDFAGRPLAAASQFASLVTDATYLPFGPATEIGFGNGTRKTMQYDSRYRIVENKLTGPAGTIAEYDYSYDPAANITGIADATDPGYDRSFAYDGLSRLTTANTGSKLWGSGGYSFDAMGNMLALTIGAAGGVGSRAATFYRSGTTAKLAGVTENGTYRDVQYDGAGNETRYLLDRAYSPRNLLATVDRLIGPLSVAHRIAYAYDGRGVRVARSEGNAGTAANLTSKRFYVYTPELQLLMMTAWDRPNPFKSTSWANLIESEFIWFGGAPVAQTSPFNLPPPRYTFTDHLGTPILQTDETAQVVWRAEYEPFGNVFKTITGNRDDQPLRFPGQEAAMTYEGSEENYNVFRWYRAGWGRYTQADPIGLAGGENLYRYARANPLTFVDRGGLSAASALPWALGCAASDGPLPVGDIIGLAILGAAVADEAARGKCNKCGDCTPTEHALLQGLVNEHCKSGLRKCTAQMDLQTLQANLTKNVSCALAREDINRRCYGGGDAGHRQAANEARAAAANCLYHLWKLMELNPNFIDPNNP